MISGQPSSRWPGCWETPPTRPQGGTVTPGRRCVRLAAWQSFSWHGVCTHQASHCCGAWVAAGRHRGGVRLWWPHGSGSGESPSSAHLGRVERQSACWPSRPVLHSCGDLQGCPPTANHRLLSSSCCSTLSMPRRPVSCCLPPCAPQMPETRAYVSASMLRRDATPLEWACEVR